MLLKAALCSTSPTPTTTPPETHALPCSELTFRPSKEPILTADRCALTQSLDSRLSPRLPALS